MAELGYSERMLHNDTLGDAARAESPRIVEHQPYRTALSIVKGAPANQDPTEPKATFAFDLHALVAEKLEIEPEELRFYTAVGTSMYFHHGVAAIFETGEEFEEVLVTARITSDPHAFGGRADVTLYISPDELDSLDTNESYEAALQRSSDMIVGVFRDKYAQRQQ